LYAGFWYRGIPVLGSDYKLRIPLKSLGNLKRTSAFGFHRFGLAIETLGAPDIRLDFTSKSTREEVIDGLKAAVQDLSSRDSNRLQDFQPLSSREPGAVAEPNFSLPRCDKDTMSVLIGGAKINKTIKPLRIVCLTIGSRGDVQPYIVCLAIL
jgi:sterol 3beta-glucosyltransferase